MKKQKRSFFKVLITVALAAVLCMSLAVPALAADVIPGTPASPAEAQITKNFVMPDGLETPAITFTFNITKVSKDGNSTGPVIAAMPAITAPTVSYTAGQAATTTAGDLKTVTGTANILGSTAFTAAGVYVYRIEEATPPTLTGTTMTKSPAIYEMSVFVQNHPTTPGAVFVTGISFNATTADQTGGSTGKIDYDADKVLFTNTLTKDVVVVPPTAGGVASISKTVTGDYGDHTLYFPFSVTATNPSTGTYGTTYKVYIVEGGTVVTDAANFSGTILTDPTHGDYFEMTSGTAATVNLKHGQSIVFSDVPYGSTYQATETPAAGYTPSISVTTGGSTPQAIPGASTGAQRISDAGANTAAYTNAYQTVTPTGVIINNLPFILILVLAAGALVVFVVIKSRKRAAEHK
ncbi:DUF7601 domain-containing protein [Christensenella tenuis]|uniref:DUF7601 domain-containing protein n=1 Tax=Christensenella tenuis TaxID=2763033 RepID=A0ABR7EF93_9FIRM|nr:hypothetical protein [Christensenella tenuis]MBC5648051.1 hypothetical protein [Christensenella tenuis]